MEVDKKPIKKLTIKESQLKKLTTTEIDRKRLAPYEAFTQYELPWG